MPEPAEQRDEGDRLHNATQSAVMQEIGPVVRSEVCAQPRSLEIGSAAGYDGIYKEVYSLIGIAESGETVGPEWNNHFGLVAMFVFRRDRLNRK
ncbi:hypothetical protein NDU88_004937 [Pleurodeles waltl]|uniref:Uncharacterized protein n=1 Tax=Pleurodeles waltl TaxID=8319 RepID=A0AAV7WY39_PLEWA|nr:hypothetical protein NDU88_004937 [Pleurodeles waltl]